MSFTLGNFNPGSENNGKGCIHYYQLPTTENMADVLGTGYFDGIKHLLRRGDQIACYSQKSNDFLMLGVTSATPTGGVVVTRPFDSSSERLIVEIGSSLTAQGLYNSSANFGYDARGAMNWARTLCGQRFRLYNAGTSGQTTTQMLARLETDVLSRKPFAVVVQCGTNEIGNGYDSLIASRKQMYDRIIASGAYLIVRQIEPRTLATSGWTIENQKCAIAVGTWDRRYCETNPRAYFADVAKYLLDPTNTNGEWQAFATEDGTHLTPRAGYLEGLVLRDIINVLIPPSDVLISNPLPISATNIYGNLLTFAGMTGTGTNSTGGTGTPPSGSLVERVTGTTTGTVNCSVAARSAVDPTRELSMVFNPGTTATESFYFRTSSANTAGVAGAIYEAMMAIDVSAWDGWRLINLEVADQAGAFASVNYHALSNFLGGGTYKMPQHAWNGILRTPRFAPRNDQTMRWRLRVEIDGAAAGTGTIKVANPQFNRLDPSIIVPQNEYVFTT